MTLDLLSPLGSEQQLRRNYVHQLRQTIKAYLPSYIFIGEALQNALDAVRDDGPGRHRIGVTMDFVERTVSVQDSGSGFPDKPSLLFLGGGEKQGRGLAGEVGVGLKVVLFSSERFILQATNADKSIRIDIPDAYRYGEEPPPSLQIPDRESFPIDPSPAIAAGTGTSIEYVFPPRRDGELSIPELYLRDIYEDCFVRAQRDYDFSLDNAVRAKAYPSRLAALVASHLRRYSYLGSTVERGVHSRLTIEVTIRSSKESLGAMADLDDGEDLVTFEVDPTYHTVADTLPWAPNPKPVPEYRALGEGGSNLERTIRGFNITKYTKPEEFELLLINASGKMSKQVESFREKLFPKLKSVTLTVGRIPEFNQYCPGGSQRIISARGVVTHHSIEVTSGRNQQYVRCFDVVVEVDADLNYGKTLLTDMHLVSNVRKFINGAYAHTIQGACRNYVSTIRTEPREPVSFWGRQRLTSAASPLSITTVPHDENDVISLFFELAGRGFISDFKWYGLSQSDTYDGRAIIRRENEDSSVLDDPKEHYLKTIEFKLRGASIARDFDREEKNISEVALVICYELGESAIQGYQIVDWENSESERIGDLPFPHVRSVLHEARTSTEVQMLVLKDVLKDIVGEPPELPDDVRDVDSL